MGRYISESNNLANTGYLNTCKIVYKIIRVFCSNVSKFFIKALSYVEDLQRRLPRLDVTTYVKPMVLDTIYTQMNVNNNANNQHNDNAVRLLTTHTANVMYVA